MKKDTSIFRKNSLAQIQSPEELNTYIQVTSANVWIVLSGIILLLVGVIIWGIFGKITTTVKIPVEVSQNQGVFYISPQNAERVETGMAVTVEGKKAAVKELSASPLQLDETTDDYVKFIGGFSDGDFCYSGTVELPLEDGVYEGVLTLDSIHPMQFVLH